MRFRYAFALVFALLVSVAAPPAVAGGKHQGWQTTSNIGAIALTVASLGVPTARGDWQGLGEAALSDGIGEGSSLLLKSIVHEERPNGRNDHSFPSGHTTLAFAAATTLYRRYGWKYGAPAYAVATLTGVARVAAREHHWWDAVAGAAIGIGSGWLVTHPFNKHVEMVPWVSPKGGGLAVVVRW